IVGGDGQDGRGDINGNAGLGGVVVVGAGRGDGESLPQPGVQNRPVGDTVGQCSSWCQITHGNYRIQLRAVQRCARDDGCQVCPKDVLVGLGEGQGAGGEGDVVVGRRRVCGRDSVDTHIAAEVDVGEEVQLTAHDRGVIVVDETVVPD